jgi:putative two-component system response regulator
VGAEAGHILVVDDEPGVCEMIRDGLAAQGLTCTAVTEGHEAKRLLDARRVAVLVTDIAMPDVSGLDLLAHVHANLPACRVIVFTGWPNAAALAQAISLGAYDYLAKPIDMERLATVVTQALTDPTAQRPLPLRAAKAMEMEGHIRQASLDSIRALARAVEAKDPYTRRHGEQVAHYAVHLARYLETGDSQVESIRIAALLHDIGKIGIPDSILTKAGPLTAEELTEVRRHPALGAEILQSISVLAAEAKLVRHHHESWDGSGYPDGLAGAAIPLGARIINVADSIDAMLMSRTYKPAYPVEEALQRLTWCAGSQFDPDLVEAAVAWCRLHPRQLILPH